MRVPSGTTDRYVYFVAVDSTDLKTRETGLSSFTVYRSRNGAAAAAMSSPTVNETDATNMAGVYELLLDEDTTLAAGNDSEEMVLHITATGMAPVTRSVEIYRPETTEGSTLAVADVASILADSNEIQSDWANGGRLDLIVDGILADTSEIGAAGAGLTDLGGMSTAMKAQVNTEADSALSDYDPPTKTEMDSKFSTTDGKIDVVDGIVDNILVDTAEIGAAGAGLTAVPYNSSWDAEIQSEVTDALNAYDPPTKAELDSGLAGLNDPTAAAISDAVWDEATSGHTSAGSYGKAVGDGVTAWVTATGFSTHSATDVWSAGSRTLSAFSFSVDVSTIESGDATDALETAATASLNSYDPPTKAEMDSAHATTDALISTVDAVVDSILVDTAEIGAAGAGLTAVPYNSSWDAEIQSEVTDALNAYDPPTKAELDSGLAGLNDISTAQVNAEVDTALSDIHLDHLLAADYDPASKPGTATSLLNELVEDDGGVSRFTTNALEQGPSGSGGGDATEAKQDQLIAAVITNAAGTDVAADIIAIKAETAAIVADTNELQTDDVPSLISGLNDPTAATIADAVWDEAQSGHTTSGTFGEYLDAQVSTVGGGSLTASAVADAVWDEATSGHTSAGSYGKAVGDGVTSWVTATGFSTHSAGDVWSESTRTLSAFGFSVDVTTIESGDATTALETAATASLNSYDPPTKAELDSGLAGLNDPTVAAISDAVWDEATSGHTSAGSYGKSVGDGVTSWVTATGFSSHSASDVWDVATRVLTANTNLNDPTAAAIRTEIDSNSTQLAALVSDSPNNPVKNAEFAGFTFLMVDSGDNITGKTGATVSASRSLDGAAFASCANSVTEVGDGIYKITLAAADMNADSVTLKFSATGCNNRFVTMITQPT